MTILAILNQIANTSATNGKIALIAAHADNEVFKTVLFLAHDPNTTFGLKNMELTEGTVHAGNKTLEESFELLAKLASRQLTGNAAREAVGSMFNELSIDDAIVFSRILKQDLRIAAGIKNINKALGKDFLKETPYMRCSLTTKDTLKRFKWSTDTGEPGVVSEVKMDGQYLNHLIRNLQYSAESRNGKPYDFLGVMDSDFAKLAQILETDFNIIDPVFNGEAVVVDSLGTVLPRTTGNGIIQTFGKGTGTLFDAESVVAVLWDVIPYEAYKQGSWDVPRKYRREIMAAALDKLQSDKIRMVEFKPVMSFAEAWKYNTDVMARGDEGTIIKDERGPWKAHTSPWQLKMKLSMEVDVKVVGFEEGASGKKFEGSLGALIVESACGTLRCKVGSGFKELFCPKKDIGTKKEYSDDMVRQYIWDNRAVFAGAICQLKVNDIVIDKRTNMPSFFLPVFDCWRHDKDQYDTLERMYEIKEAAIIAAYGE